MFPLRSPSWNSHPALLRALFLQCLQRPSTGYSHAIKSLYDSSRIHFELSEAGTARLMASQEQNLGLPVSSIEGLSNTIAPN